MIILEFYVLASYVIFPSVLLLAAERGEKLTVKYAALGAVLWILSPLSTLILLRKWIADNSDKVVWTFK